MSRYFFHTQNGSHHHDHDGMEFADLDTAKAAALRHLSQLLTCQDRFWETEGLQLTVTDEHGMTLLTVDVTPTLAPALGAAK